MGANSLEEALQDLDSRILDILDKCKSKIFILCLTESNCFRYDLATIVPYKGNRKKGSKPIIYYALKQHLKQKYQAYSNDRLEADDIVGYLSIALKNDYMLTIASPDKDVIKQVEGFHYNYGKCTKHKTTATEAIKFLYTQTLTGDVTDNIQGIKGIGIVTATKILENGSGSMAGKALDAYIKEFGISSGVHKFQENFRLVYLLRTDDDMLREIGLLPSMPVIQSINFENFNNDDPSYSQF
jgi:5'-3' exonuclease